MVRKHTQQEYGRLLKEYLEKKSLRIGLWMEAGARGWEGSMTIARGMLTAEDCGNFAFEMHSDASVYVDDEGSIRIYYAEPIVVNSARKAARDAARKERESRQVLCENDFAACEDEYIFDCFDDEAVCGEEMEEVEDKPCAAQKEIRQAVSETENLEYISEEEELKLLRALNEIPYEFSLYSRKNETRLIYHGRYRMDSCSRNSAKKAAEYIYDELYVACSYLSRLSMQLGFERVKPPDAWNGWKQANVIDDFSQIHGYIAAQRRQAEKEAKEEAERRRAESEAQIEWKEEWGDPHEILRTVGKRIEEKDPTLKFSEMLLWNAAQKYLEQDEIL